MPSALADLLQFSFVALTSILFLVDPIAAIPTFLAMTADQDRIQRRHMAKRAAWTCLVVLSGFAAAGKFIFQLFGITLPAFKIAGGVILLLIGLDMLRARRSQTKETPGEAEEGAEKEDVGIIPLGIPMLAGPGAISTVMVLIGGKADWRYWIPVFLAIVIVSVVSYWILAGADSVRQHLGETGIRILTRLMGLMLTAIAIQFMLNGLADVGLVKSGAHAKVEIPADHQGRRSIYSRSRNPDLRASSMPRRLII
jgi:multiple antibiotic resistance protein